MVLRELLGPGSGEEEIVESPGTRYFVGVLAPRKRATASSAPPRPAAVPPPPADEADGEADGEILDTDELALGARTRPRTARPTSRPPRNRPRR